jgi:hypothetical protein
VAQEERERLAIDIASPEAVSAQRLELRAEDERVGELPIVKRLLAEAVPGQPQHALGRIPQAEREHSPAALEGADEAPLLDGREQHLGVAAAAEARATRGELRAQRAEVIDLAIEGDRVAAARRAHRLGPER